MIDNHARVIVLLIDPSQIDNDFMATIASFCNSHTQNLMRASFINHGAPCTLNLTFVLPFRIPFCIPGFRLSQSPCIWRTFSNSIYPSNDRNDQPSSEWRFCIPKQRDIGIAFDTHPHLPFRIYLPKTLMEMHNLIHETIICAILYWTLRMTFVNITMQKLQPKGHHQGLRYKTVS